MIRVRHWSTFVTVFAVAILAGFLFKSSAQKTRTASSAGKASADTSAVDDLAPSEMRSTLEYYVVDRGSLQRSFPVASSPARRERFRKFYSDALERIQKLNFDGMSQEGKADYILFRTHLSTNCGNLMWKKTASRGGAVDASCQDDCRVGRNPPTNGTNRFQRKSPSP
jgi:hypothetical protein